MDKLISFQKKADYLLVIGHGQRDSLASMTQASAYIYDKVVETGSRYLLVDYRTLKINVHLNEAFNIVRRYETGMPVMKELIIAGVFSEQGLDFGTYWMEVARQRGFVIQIFEDIGVAERWLLSQIKN